ncbi:MAG: heat-inducible transcriptional repressor HrcA [bacterium]
MINLTEREELLLKLIVEDFVETAVPVSSGNLCNKHKLPLSSATVRNVMMDLERNGLLWQPHISAGRIPTDLGYRLYVDKLMTVGHLSREERQKVLDDLRRVSRDFEQIIEKASKILGEISSQLGIVLLPRFYDGVFAKLELVQISGRRLMLVLTIKSGLVKTVLLELDFDVPRETLEITTQMLNERLSGLTLGEIKQTIDHRLKSVSIGSPELITYFQNSAETLFDFDDWEHYYFGGTQNILRQPEFSSASSVGGLMEFLESKQRIIQFMGRLRDRSSLRVSIGRENAARKMDTFSLVASNYKIGNVHGVLGIIGPTRMDYSRMVSIVNYMSRAISKVATN